MPSYFLRDWQEDPLHHWICCKLVTFEKLIESSLKIWSNIYFVFLEFMYIYNMTVLIQFSGTYTQFAMPSFPIAELYRASQCFKSRGIPKVAFKCPPNHMIKIHRAFHGISNRDRSPEETEEQCPSGGGPTLSNCTQCQGDCIDDSMNLVYDWSTCMGNTSCIRTVMQSYMPACPGRDKFSDYLQVEYQCIPRKWQTWPICSWLWQWVASKDTFLFTIL